MYYTITFLFNIQDYILYSNRFNLFKMEPMIYIRMKKSNLQTDESVSKNCLGLKRMTLSAIKMIIQKLGWEYFFMSHQNSWSYLFGFWSPFCFPSWGVVEIEQTLFFYFKCCVAYFSNFILLLDFLSWVANSRFM